MVKDPTTQAILLASMEGVPKQEIAEALELDLNTVITVLESPIAKKKLRELKANQKERIKASASGSEVNKELMASSLDAAKTLGELSEFADSERTRLRAAKEILDHTHEQKRKTEHVHTVEISDSQADLLTQTMREMNSLTSEEPEEVEVIREETERTALPSPG